MKRSRVMLTVMVCATALFLAGCSHLREFARTVWGSSTRALEEARVNAVRKTFRCNLQECFEAVDKIVKDQQLTMFQESELREFMVIMNIPKSIDTTEVGLFFSRLGDKKTRIDVSSLSTPAKEHAAAIIFPVLAQQFPEIPTADLSQKKSSPTQSSN